MKRLILIACAALMLTSCFKETSYDTACVIKPLVQKLSGDDYIPLVGTKAFAFAGSTENWTIESYEDALAGVATSIVDGQKVPAIAESSPYKGSESELEINLNREFLIIVVVDPASQTFAYNDYELPKNFEKLEIKLPFLPWKATTYKVGKWSFVVPELTHAEVIIDPSVVSVEGAPKQPLTGAKSFVFDASASEIHFENYEEALQGIARNTESGEVVEPISSSEPYGDSASQIVVSAGLEQNLLLVVDPASSSYAYRDYKPASSARIFREDLTFETWKVEDYSASSWKYVVLASEDETAPTE